MSTKSAAETREQVAEVFKQFDTDGNGVLDREELEVALKAMDGAFFTPDRVNQLMMCADVDGDNKIGFMELLDWIFSGDGRHGQQYRSIEVGRFVFVTQDFQNMFDKDVSFKTGERGYVRELDEEGDAQIDFNDHEEGRWISKKNFDKLKVEPVKVKTGRLVTVLSDFEFAYEEGVNIYIYI